MKRSIRANYMAVLIVIVAAIIVSNWVAINFFLESFYLNDKQNTLIDVYSELQDTMVLDDGEVSDDTLVYLRQVTEAFNIDICLWDSSQSVLYISGNDDLIPGGNTLMSYLLGRQDIEESLVSTDNYEINRTYDMMTDAYYLEMFAVYDNSCFTIMRVPLQSIQETVSIVSRFQLYISLIVAVLGIILAWIFTKNLAKPIQKLSYIAGRMENLDFTIKYESKGKTELDQLGASINNMSEKLEKTIVELKEANLELKRDIEQKTRIDEMRVEFLSNVSHELKTPIALIQGYAEGLKDGINDDPESMEFYCDVIIDEASKMNTMVRKLLALNQIESGRDQLELEHFDVLAVIAGVLNSYQLLIRQKEADVILKSPDSMYIYADEYMTEEVVRNYVGNALNHLANGNRIEITVTQKGDKAHIEVFNNGEHIPESDIDRIWEKFYKVDKARTREYGGSGIGLSIVKAVMESHNNDYGVYNTEGGVCFWCEFDCA